MGVVGLEVECLLYTSDAQELLLALYSWVSVGSAWETDIAVPGMELGSATCKESASPVPFGFSDPIYVRCEERGLTPDFSLFKVQDSNKML